MWRSGIFGNVSVNGTPVTGWRFRGGFEGVAESPMMATISDTSWTALLGGQWAAAATAPSDNKPKLWRMDFDYTPPADAIETWALNATVTTNSQGVVWVNGHCLGRQITSQPPLFVPQCWLKGTNTFIILTHDGSVPQGYSLRPVEYYSFAKVPTSVVVLPPGRVGASATSACFLVTGGRFTVPKEFRGLPIVVCVFDMAGKQVVKMRTNSGRLQLRSKGRVLTGAYVVRIQVDKSLIK
jgi:hypothetical protein